MPAREVKDRGYWQRRAFANWRDTGLPNADRHEFAGQLFGRDVRSWSQLTVAELGVIVHVLRGWHLIEELRRQRGTR